MGSFWQGRGFHPDRWSTWCPFPPSALPPGRGRGRGDGFGGRFHGDSFRVSIAVSRLNSSHTMGDSPVARSSGDICPIQWRYPPLSMAFCLPALATAHTRLHHGKNRLLDCRGRDRPKIDHLLEVGGRARGVRRGCFGVWCDAFCAVRLFLVNISGKFAGSSIPVPSISEGNGGSWGFWGNGS